MRKTIGTKQRANSAQEQEDRWVARVNALARDIEERSHSIHPSAWHETFAAQYEAFFKLAQAEKYDPKTQQFLPRTLALKCESDSPGWVQSVQIISIWREDSVAWYGRDGTLWPKFAWKQVPMEGALEL